MSAFRINQRVRYVRKPKKEDAKYFRPIIDHEAFVRVPVGTEGTITRVLIHADGTAMYNVLFDGFDERGALGYMIEPLTDSYQLSSWENLKEIWSPHESKESNKTPEPAHS